MEQGGCTSTTTSRVIVDTHICGACGSKFTDVKEFLQHKEEGCQSASRQDPPLDHPYSEGLPAEPRGQGHTMGNPQQTVTPAGHTPTNQLADMTGQGEHSLSQQAAMATQDSQYYQHGSNLEPPLLISNTFSSATEILEENVQQAGEILAQMHQATQLRVLRDQTGSGQSAKQHQIQGSTGGNQQLQQGNFQVFPVNAVNDGLSNQNVSLMSGSLHQQQILHSSQPVSEHQAQSSGVQANIQHPPSGVQANIQHPPSGVQANIQHPPSGVQANIQHPPSGVQANIQHPPSGVQANIQHPPSGVQANIQHPPSGVQSNVQHPPSGVQANIQHPPSGAQANIQHPHSGAQAIIQHLSSGVQANIQHTPSGAQTNIQHLSSGVQANIQHTPSGAQANIQHPPSGVQANIEQMIKQNTVNTDNTCSLPHLHMQASPQAPQIPLPEQDNVLEILQSQQLQAGGVMAPESPPRRFCRNTRLGNVRCLASMPVTLLRNRPENLTSPINSSILLGLTNKNIKKPRSVPPKKFSCDYEGCTFVTAYMKDLDRHKRTHTGERPFTCSYCQKTFNRNDKLKIHLRGHTGDKPYTCQLCSYASADSSSLKKHLRTHTNERPFKCQVCTYASRNSSQLIVHLRSHTGDAPFQCQLCDAKFKINTDLKRHMRTHTGEKPYSCNQCEYKCSVKSNLKSHMRVNHSEEFQLKCDLCEFTCSSKKSFKEHLKLHNPDKPERCPTCDYLCAGKTALKNHMRIHSEEKPFRCDFCSYASKQNGNVKTHIRKRHPDRLRSRSHVRVTTNRAAKEKPAEAAEEEAVNGRPKRPTRCRQSFKCDECDASFVREDSLRSHTRQHLEISTLESTALAVLELQNPVTHPPMESQRTAQQKSVSQQTETDSVQEEVVMDNTHMDSLNHNQPLVSNQVPGTSQQNQQNTCMSVTVSAAQQNYLYTTSQGPGGMVTAAPVNPLQLPLQQQMENTCISSGSQVAPTATAVASTPLVSQRLSDSQAVQSTMGLQVLPNIQYPVIRLANGQMYQESQFIAGTQFIAGQGGENVVAVLGTPMFQFQPEMAQQQQHQSFDHQQQQPQQVQIFQDHNMQIQQQKAFQQHHQQQSGMQPQLIAAPDSILTGDGTAGGIPLSIQLLPQQVSQVIEHPLGGTQGTVQVVLPPGAQAFLPPGDAGRGRGAGQMVVHMSGMGPAGDHTGVAPTLLPVQFIQGVSAGRMETNGGKSCEMAMVLSDTDKTVQQQQQQQQSTADSQPT